MSVLVGHADNAFAHAVQLAVSEPHPFRSYCSSLFTVLGCCGLKACVAVFM